MRYLCLGYLEPELFDGLSHDEQRALLDDCLEYNEKLRVNGNVVAELPLQPPETALTLSWRNGQVATVDGPCVESREQLGGLHILEARDLNHAVQLISQHPGMKLGTFEIRPVADLDELLRESERRRREEIAR